MPYLDFPRWKQEAAQIVAHLEGVFTASLAGQPLPHCQDLAYWVGADIISRWASDRPGFADTMSYTAARWEFVTKWSFAMPCGEAIEAIAEHGPILEIGAGSGLWAGLLRHHTEVFAVDPGTSLYAFDGEDGAKPFDIGAFSPVERLDHRAGLAARPGWTVFMCWPDLGNPYSAEVARTLSPGQKLVYIGEGSGGCTGTDEFHQILDGNYDPIDGCAIPQWWGLHDHLVVYEKKGRK